MVPYDIDVELDDALFDKVAARAAELGVKPDDLLEDAINRALNAERLAEKLLHPDRAPNGCGPLMAAATATSSGLVGAQPSVADEARELARSGVSACRHCGQYTFRWRGKIRCGCNL